MTKFEQITQYDLESFAAWLDSSGFFDGAPWVTWWDANFCSKCPSIEVIVPELGPEHKTSVAYCEIHDECKFCPGNALGNKKIIELWLASEVD